MVRSATNWTCSKGYITSLDALGCVVQMDGLIHGWKFGFGLDMTGWILLTYSYSDWVDTSDRQTKECIGMDPSRT